jgi:hypothetical protein
VEQAVLAINTLREISNFGTDKTIGHRIHVRSTQAFYPAVLDFDFEAAGVRAIHCANGREKFNRHK